jgi:hypothetical protein
MWKSDGVSQHPPSQDPYRQQDPYAAQQGYSQPMYPGYPQYQQQAPRKPLDIGMIVFVGAWVVFGFFSLKFLYVLFQDEAPFGHEDFADRLFGGIENLGVGLFYTGLLLGLSVWLRRNQHQSEGA